MQLYTMGAIAPHFEKELRAILAAAGIIPILTIAPLPAILEAALDEWDGNDLTSFICERHGARADERFLVSARGDWRFKSWCKSEAPHAEWGCSGSLIAVDYAPPAFRLRNQLHEALHLFEVHDCYGEADLRPLPSCDLEGCLMRYGSPSTQVCESVLKQLRREFGE